MTRHQYNKSIHYQLRALNERIDYKILRGQDYSAESRRHKMLRERITRQSKRGFLTQFLPRVFQF